MEEEEGEESADEDKEEDDVLAPVVNFSNKTNIF